MKKPSAKAVWQNLKGNAPFLLSLAALLCLLLQPSLLYAATLGTAFLAACAVCALHPLRKGGDEPAALSFLAGMLGVLLGFRCYDLFLRCWGDSGYAALAAGYLSVPVADLLQGLARLGFATGFYALYMLLREVLCRCAAAGISFFADRMEALPRRRLAFFLSAGCFFLLSWASLKQLPLGLLLPWLSAAAFAAVLPRMLERVRRCGLGLRLFSMLTAMGTCWYGQHQMAFFPQMPPRALSVVLAVGGIYFCYVCVMFLMNQLLDIFGENATFAGLPRWEKWFYLLLYLALAAGVAAVFLQTDAFYGTSHYYDIIYTSDSPSLIKHNAFLTLMHSENDLRQPLFAVFSAPFAGIPMLLGMLTGASGPVQAVLLNSAQIALLLLSVFLVARMLELTPVKRVCFLVLGCCMYSGLLFLLMMEQYIVACFWLILYVYQASRGKQPGRICLWGLGGTLLTSLILMPLMSAKHPVKEFRGWLQDMIRYGLEFVGVLLLFCRFDVLFSLTEKLIGFTSFSGEKLTMADKILQYSQFLRNCFLAPEAGTADNVFGQISWQMPPVTALCVTGIVLLALAVFSAVWNRESLSCRMAGFWMGFSVLLLVVMGWGTAENGLLLYVLYFSWALLLLLFRLADRLGAVLRIPALAPALSLAGAGLLLARNLPALAEMIRFGLTYYPV